MTNYSPSRNSVLPAKINQTTFFDANHIQWKSKMHHIGFLFAGNDIVGLRYRPALTAFKNDVLVVLFLALFNKFRDDLVMGRFRH